MNYNEKISLLVQQLDEELEKHNLNFDEYLLLKAIHTYELGNDKMFANLELKGFIKDNKVVDPILFQNIEDDIFENDLISEYDKDSALFGILRYVWFYNPVLWPLEIHN